MQHNNTMINNPQPGEIWQHTAGWYALLLERHVGFYETDNIFTALYFEDGSIDLIFIDHSHWWQKIA
jgi:hypothetical protein